MANLASYEVMASLRKADQRVVSQVKAILARVVALGAVIVAARTGAGRAGGGG